MMETLVDTPSRHPSTLPPIGYMESDKRRMDELEAQISGVHNISKSPTSVRYNAPPPLYTPSMPASGPGVISPPNSRRTSSEEQQPPTQARQAPSLPRLHEALEGVNGMKYPPGAPPPPPPSSQHVVSTSSFFPTPSAVATSDSARRPFEPQSAYGEAKTSYSSHSTPTTAQHPSPRSNSFPGSSTGYSSLPHKAPPVPPIRTGGSSPTGSAPRRPSAPYQPGSHPPTPFEPSPQSAPASSYSGYSGYQSTTYSYQPETPTGHAPAVLSAPTQFSAGQAAEQERGSSERKPNPPYGESVKRRLDHFQFQRSLCDFIETAAQLQKFAELWQRRSYEHDRSINVPQSVVSAQEVEDLIPRVQMLNDSYRGIREAVLSSTTSVSGDDSKEVVRLVMHNGYGHEVNGYGDGSKDFGPPDSKKRRGATSRAAPPGRCHSCNRAETPEWRRGPDGARTLCNACGLHYAKLTRKLGANKVAMANSSMRPRGPNPQ